MYGPLSTKTTSVFTECQKPKNAENGENRKMQEILKSENQSFFPQEPIYV